MRDINIRVFAIEPLTPLMFRKPKPFELGDLAESNLYPSPATIAGMIRSVIWEALDRSFNPQSLIEDSKFTGVIRKDNRIESTYNFEWRLIGPYLQKINGDNAGIYYPAPTDIFIHEETNDVIMPDINSMKELSNLLNTDGGFIPNINDKNILQDLLRFKLKSVSGKFIHIDDLRAILNHKSPRQIRLASFDDILERKREAHIALDHEHKTLIFTSTGKGLYFTTSKIVLKRDWRFIFGVITLSNEIDNYFDHLNGKIARFGGEGGYVRIHEIEVELIEHDYIKKGLLCKPLPTPVKLTLTSPAVFLDNNDYNVAWPCIIKNNNIYRPNYYAIKQVLVSGWDYISNKPKSLHIGIDAGSVYYYEVLPKDITYYDIIVKRIHVAENFRGAYGSTLVDIKGE